MSCLAFNARLEKASSSIVCIIFVVSSWMQMSFESNLQKSSFLTFPSSFTNTYITVALFITFNFACTCRSYTGYVLISGWHICKLQKTMQNYLFMKTKIVNKPVLIHNKRKKEANVAKHGSFTNHELEVAPKRILQ